MGKIPPYSSIPCLCWLIASVCSVLRQFSVCGSGRSVGLNCIRCCGGGNADMLRSQNRAGPAKYFDSFLCTQPWRFD